MVHRNLGWKLAGVVKKELNSSVLSTFETERHPIAAELIDADRFQFQNFNMLESSKPAWIVEREAELENFMLGFSIQYPGSCLTLPLKAEAIQPQALAPGKRFPKLFVCNHATAKSFSMQSLLKSDGRFHIVIFAGDISQAKELARINDFGETLSRNERDSLPASAGFNIVVVHSARRTNIELASLEATFFPLHERMGPDYDRVYCDLDAAYEDIGVGEEGGVVFVRPDQYVGYCGGLLDTMIDPEPLESYLRGFFRD